MNVLNLNLANIIETKRNAILEVYFENGIGNERAGIKGTLWAAYNGITEYIDYHKKLRKSTDRTKYLLFGDGADIKERALVIAKNILEHKN